MNAPLNVTEPSVTHEKVARRVLSRQRTLYDRNGQGS